VSREQLKIAGCRAKTSSVLAKVLFSKTLQPGFFSRLSYIVIFLAHKLYPSAAAIYLDTWNIKWRLHNLPGIDLK